MKAVIKYIPFLALVFLVSCSDKIVGTTADIVKEKVESKLEVYYSCSMHPKVKEKEDGKCPLCHMNLTRVEVDRSETIESQRVNSNKTIAAKVIGRVKLNKSQLSHFRPEYFPVTKKSMKKKIRLLGTVLQSEEKESKIPARIAGRIEKVYVKSTGSTIKKGDPVVDLYSPRLITAGEEYLIAKKSFDKTQSNEYKEMLDQSKERLRLWGIRSFQYKSWLRKGKVPRSIVIYSSANGIVRKRNAIVGKYFKEGQNFFELSDLSDVWVEMDVYEQDAALISIGQSIKLEFTSIPGEFITGEVDFVAPVLDSKSRTLKIRTTIENKSGKIKPGMVADGSLTIFLDGRPMVIPRSALIDTGKRKVVWVKVNDNTFQAKEVHVGQESDGYIEVKNGLMIGEEVVIEGSFLLDAQAQLFGGYHEFND
jgi:membrane fusion protein, copper/silver efflux system